MTYNKSEDYCTKSPDKLFGVDFGIACHNHDRQYRDETKNRTSRLKADFSLMIDITKQFYKKNKLLFPLGLLTGFIYFLAVRILGIGLWIKNQKEVK